MKRSQELSPLSRDHHRALYAALRLRRADDRSGSGAVEEFLDFWTQHGQRHFEIEEELLLPGFALGGGDPRHELVVRVLTDHVEIRSRARALTSGASIPDLHELGDLLTAHVRLEEDELFPLIESTLDADALVTLGQEIEAAERER